MYNLTGREQGKFSTESEFREDTHGNLWLHGNLNLLYGNIWQMRKKLDKEKSLHCRV